MVLQKKRERKEKKKRKEKTDNDNRQLHVRLLIGQSTEVGVGVRGSSRGYGMVVGRKENRVVGDDVVWKGRGY